MIKIGGSGGQREEAGAILSHGASCPGRQKDSSVFRRLCGSPVDAAARGLGDGAVIRVYNQRGSCNARARVTDQIPVGTVWMRDGWAGLNNLTGGQAVLPDIAVDMFGFSAGQASFEALVEVALR